jgi:hypothetical protein
MPLRYTENSFVLGDFIWTAIDYIGESAIGSAATTPDMQEAFGQPWEWHVSFCGDIDIVGMQKPQAFYRTVLWDAAQINMLVHSPMVAHQTEQVAPLSSAFFTSTSLTTFSIHAFSKNEPIALLTCKQHADGHHKT